jgi:hypothetical protein
MDLLRQPPFPLEVTYSDLNSSEEYLLQIYSDKSRLMHSINLMSDEDGEIIYSLPEYYARFDGTYSLYIYELDDGHPANTAVIDTLSISRPYVNPYTIANTDLEEEQAIYNEKLARMIIDSFTGGFYYTEGTMDLVGLGADFLPVPNRINRLNFLYRNNVKVYDRFDEEVVQDRYVVTPDHTAITIRQAGLYNRHQSMPVQLPLGASDSFNLYSDSNDPIAALTKIREFALFPKDYDYTLVGEFGWPVVPQDIQRATLILMEDIACNKLDYISRYVTEYKTDQFTVKYSDVSLKGTGNMIVDNILAPYQNNFYKLGVL